MASVQDGVSLLTFGTTTVTGYVIESVSEPTTSESVLIQDEDGQYITDVNNFGIMTSVSLTVIPKSGTSIPAIGDTFTYNGSSKITIKEITVNSVNKDVTRWDIKGDRFPDITLA